MDRLRLCIPLIVEGRYDKSTLAGFLDGVIITTEGFGIFKNRKKQEYLRKICENGVILLTDSDGGGRQIRSFLQGILPSEKVYNLYVPKIAGKEKRKSRPSKSGTLGVEGMTRELLTKLLLPFTTEMPPVKKREITKADLFADGLTGKPDSSILREKLCILLDLPPDMTPNGLLEALNLLLEYEEYRNIVGKINIDC